MGRYYNPDDFIMQYPGVYTGAAKAAMDKYFATLDGINNTEVCGADIIAGRVKEPKLGAVLEISGNMIRYCNSKYAPEYEIALDPEIAKAHGYKDIFGMIGFSACDDVYTMPSPPEARDTLLVSQICHEITSVTPVYPGDTIYMVRDKTIVTDMTPPEGSLYRHLHQQNYGTVYNQKGEIVNKVLFTLMESVKLYKDECLPKPREQFGFADMWEDPDWFARPQHIYTDDDYARLKRIWKNEVARGENPLFWDELAVGYELPEGTFGPIYDGIAPTKPYGMGVCGGVKLKRYFLDESLSGMLVRDDATGIYTTSDAEINSPATPDGIKPFFLAPPDEAEEPKSGEINTADIHKTANERSALINLMGRDIAAAHILNFIGYNGRMRTIRWSIMSPDVHAKLGKPVPASDSFVCFTRRLPGMEAATIDAHGLTTDVALVRACVADKYVENTEHVAVIVYWLEDIDGNTWLTGEAEVVLPARSSV